MKVIKEKKKKKKKGFTIFHQWNIGSEWLITITNYFNFLKCSLYNEYSYTQFDILPLIGDFVVQKEAQRNTIIIIFISFCR